MEALPPNSEEQQYLDLAHRIIHCGTDITDTRAVFGAMMRFDLSRGFPLLTTKRVFWRGVVEELLWFIAGCTDAKKLDDRGVKIWNANSSRQYLDSRGFVSREVGDLGPVYGFQWRHFGATYSDCHADYTGQGVDQLARVIHAITTTPTSRQIIMSAWNPAAIDDMALPPCHVVCHFRVSTQDGGTPRLNCSMFQRSCDMGLGVPFNIASYSLLTHLIAKTCGLDVGEFVYFMSDVHIYNNHVEALRAQTLRVPRPFPQLTVNHNDIFTCTADDIVLAGYDPHPSIAMTLTV